MTDDEIIRLLGKVGSKAVEEIRELLEERKQLQADLEQCQQYIVHLEEWVERIRPLLEYREAENKRLMTALEPFAHPDLSEILGGNAEGDKSVVFGRNKANLTIGDFKRAAAALKEESQ